jgi:hypothetical protein
VFFRIPEDGKRKKTVIPHPHISQEQAVSGKRVLVKRILSLFCK